MQLYRLNELHEEFATASIQVVAITAEPGGDEMIRHKLRANGLPPLSFPVYSDPSWHLMTLPPREQIYIEAESHPFLLKAGQFSERYRMVQPALVIVNDQGEVVYWWSWSVL